jgi:hypothetical protein
MVSHRFENCDPEELRDRALSLRTEADKIDRRLAAGIDDEPDHMSVSDWRSLAKEYRQMAEEIEVWLGPDWSRDERDGPTPTPWWLWWRKDGGRWRRVEVFGSVGEAAGRCGGLMTDCANGCHGAGTWEFIEVEGDEPPPADARPTGWVEATEEPDEGGEDADA